MIKSLLVMSQSTSPVPSITLHITKNDAERFLHASKALLEKLNDVRHNQADEAPDEGSDKPHSEKLTVPLHQMMYDVAIDCNHEFVLEFLSRVSSLLEPKGAVIENDKSQTLSEIQAALLLFHDCDKTTKLRHLFSIFSTNDMQLPQSIYSDEEKKDDNHKDEKSDNIPSALSQQGVITLFRTVLTAISCCVRQPEQHSSKGGCHTKQSDDKVRKHDGEITERPLKKPKLEQNDDVSCVNNEKSDDDFGEAHQCPSWDSLASLRDEDDISPPVQKQHNDLQHEILGIAEFAAHELFAFAEKRRQLLPGKDSMSKLEHSLIDLAVFGEWYNKTGSTVVPWLELLQLSKWVPAAKKKDLVYDRKGFNSDASMAVASSAKSTPTPSLEYSTIPSLKEEKHIATNSSKVLVSFDFSGSGSPVPLLINITEDNLLALQALVYKCQLIRCGVSDFCQRMLQAGSERTIGGQKMSILCKADYMKAVKRIIPSCAYSQLSPLEREAFDESFSDFFFCFEESRDGLHVDEVDLREFTVGLCLLCAGNKSSKLLKGFDLVDCEGFRFLTEKQLSRYLQCYLTMLVALSLIVPESKRQTRRPLSRQDRNELRSAVESGANWTLSHFLKSVGKENDEYTFESFATWYSDGGYTVAPWLELLDLKKVMSLIGEPHIHLHLPPLANLEPDCSTNKVIGGKTRDRVSSLRRHHSSRRGPTPEILFTFPLGNRRSLVVLKEDALYVRDVVEKLGLLSMNPDYLWNALRKAAEKRQKTAARNAAIVVDMAVFVECMKEVCLKQKRKTSTDTGLSSTAASLTIEEILANFYQCFDIDQCDSVALDELMGGLTLLCGGKKSTKLAFAFSIFDTRPGLKSDRVTHSLSGEDLFVFLRSVLIVTFSTCRQSLDMSDKIVSLCITDTANMICNDVMRHQWETKQLNRLDFDEFGQWYNEGGFERAPWLELLDLNKWVLLENSACTDKSKTKKPIRNHSSSKITEQEPLLRTNPTPSPQPELPPPPNDDALDNSFLDDIDSMDEMDMMLMQSSSVDRDALKISKSFSYSNASPPIEAKSTKRPINPLKFHLVTTDSHGGYMLSLSTLRIAHFRRVLESSGLYNLDVETACNHIIGKGRSKLSKKYFDSAFQTLLSTHSPAFPIDKYTQKAITGVFDNLFKAFDRQKSGEVCAIEVACGFTVLCRGKKSDKLEFAFEVLDKRKRGRLSRADMSNYLRSFLTVLLNVAFTSSLDSDPVDDTVCTMNGSPCDKSTDTLIQVVQAGADWAASLAFGDFVSSRHEQRSSMSFDDFASWYTRTGYSSIPWLELLDLQKWAMVQEPKI